MAFIEKYWKVMVAGVIIGVIIGFVLMAVIQDKGKLSVAMLSLSVIFMTVGVKRIWDAKQPKK